MGTDTPLLVDLCGHYFQLVAQPFDQPHPAARAMYFDSPESAESFLRSIVNVSEGFWLKLAAEHCLFMPNTSALGPHAIVAQQIARSRIHIYSLPAIERKLAHNGKGMGYAFFQGADPLPHIAYPIREIEDAADAQTLLDSLNADKGDWVHMLDQNGLLDQDLSQKSVDGVKQLITPHLLDGTLSAYEIPYSPPRAKPQQDIVEVISEKAPTLGPEPEPKNWIDLEYKYADGTGVGGASYTVKDPGGAVVASGTLSPDGKAYVVLPQDIVDVTVEYHDDPADVATVKSGEPVQAEDPPGWFERISDNVKQTWVRDWEVRKKAAKWVWGTVQGDFNEDPSVSQIITNAVITMIPVVDQIGDVRDIIANLKLLVWDKKYNEPGPWLGLFFTLIGLIPTIGSALKGILKLIWRGSKLADVLKVFNYFMKGNGIKWLKELQGGKLDDYAKQAASIGEDVFDAIIRKLSELKNNLPEALKDTHQQLKELLDLLDETKGMINEKFADIAKQMKEKLDDILKGGSGEAGEKATAKGNYSTTQEAEAPKEDSQAWGGEVELGSGEDPDRSTMVGGGSVPNKTSNTSTTGIGKNIVQQLDELKQQGHGPQRHGGDVTHQQLVDRAVHGKDPVTGTAYDAYRKNPDGTPALHLVGRNATRFKSNSALVNAEAYIRNSPDFDNAAAAATNGRFQVDVPAKRVLGPDYLDQIEGVTRLGSKNNPTGSQATNLTDSVIRARYRIDTNGQAKLTTIYPEPQ